MQSRNPILALCLLLVHVNLCAQTLAGIRAAAMGRSSMAVSGAWTVSSNSARLADSSQQCVSIHYSPGLFQLHELRSMAIAGSMPVSFGGIGVCLEHFGFELYNEISFQAGIGIPLLDHCSLGATAVLQRCSIAGYGSSLQWMVNVGILGKLLPQLELGCSWLNLNAARSGAAQERLPQRMNIGIAYEPAEDFRCVLSLEKDLRYPLSIRAGIEKIFSETVFLRCGTGGSPSVVTGGFGVRLSPVEVGYAVYHHGELGLTHQCELQYCFGR